MREDVIVSLFGWPAAALFNVLVVHRATLKAVAVFCVVGAVLLIAYHRPQVGARWFRRIDCWLRQVGQRRFLAMALAGLTAVVISAMYACIRVPPPDYHDEFSYLLAADTFARGRLSNPTHPLWYHFESPHIMHRPTYASKYPPAQGLVLAAGQVIGGHPIVGVWLSMGMLCAALCWMLQAWMPPRWALGGALLAAVVLGVTYWSRSYWGGAVAATGGALLFGALRRIVCRPRVQDSLLMVSGIGLLANSRPYSGLLVSLCAAIVLCGWMLSRSAPTLRVLGAQCIVPASLACVLLAGAMAFYNFRVTGNAFRMPYQAYMERRGESVASFTWSPRTSTQAASLPQFTSGGGPRQDSAAVRQLPLLGPLWLIEKRAKKLWRFYLGPVLSIPLLMLPWTLRSGWQCFALGTCGVLVLGLFAMVPFHEHYAAPVTGLVFAMVIQNMRHLRTCRWRGRRVGRAIVRIIPLVCVGILLASLGKVMLGGSKQGKGFRFEREAVQTALTQETGKHLVLVRYGPEHSYHEEWVYNSADIDSAKVVWARELSAAQNATLLTYFKDRRSWLLLVDMDTFLPTLLPYPAALPPQ